MPKVLYKNTFVNEPLVARGIHFQVSAGVVNGHNFPVVIEDWGAAGPGQCVCRVLHPVIKDTDYLIRGKRNLLGTTVWVLNNADVAANWWHRHVL